VAVAKRFRRLGWVAQHEYRVGVRQNHRQKMDFALHAADHADGLSDVHLSMARGMQSGTNISCDPDDSPIRSPSRS
jgi:hypothetical protein